MFRPVVFNEEVCNGCNKCVDICPMDILVANSQKGKPPIVAYPDECWYDGNCLFQCPLRDKGAIRIVVPLPMRVSILRGNKP